MTSSSGWRGDHVPARIARALRAVLVACLVALSLAACSGSDASDDDGNQVWYGGGDEDVVPPALADVTAPAGADERGGIPISQEGAGVAGTGDVVVDVYADPWCPWCQRFDAQYSDALMDLVEQGGVTVVHRPLAFLDARFGGTYSTRAVNALAVVADASPQHYVAVLHALMAAQPPTDDPAGLSDDAIARLAVDAGVDRAVAERFDAVTATSYRVSVAGGGTEERTATSRLFAPWVAAATHQAALDLPQVQVPTILVDGVPVEDWTEPGSLTQRIAAAVAARG
jgi:protein-disulfide isomerase